MQKQADELVTAMNRAAEQAVPEAQALLLGAVRSVSATGMARKVFGLLGK